MKVQPTPTSPKAKLAEQSQGIESLYRDHLQNIEKPPSRRRLSLFTLVFSALIGLCAGAVGAFVADQYLDVWLEPSLTNTGTTTVPKTKATAEPSPSAVSTALSDAERSVVGLYIKNDGDASATTAYTLNGLVGNAVLLSEDGWAVTQAGALAQKKIYVGVTNNHVVATIDQQISDPSTDLVYLHFADLTKQPVIQIGSGSPMDQTLYALAASEETGQYRGRSVRIESQLSGTDTERSSDHLGRMLILDTLLPGEYAGGAVVNASGKLIGLLRSEGWQQGSTVWPADTISAVLPGLLKDSAITRPSLGARFVQIATTVGIPAKERQSATSGALLHGSATNPAIAKKSAAATAGLRSGDVIKQVGTQVITGNVDLADAIHAYEAGQTVEFTVLRSNTEQKIKVTLGSQSSTAQ